MRTYYHLTAVSAALGKPTARVWQFIDQGTFPRPDIVIGPTGELPLKGWSIDTIDAWHKAAIAHSARLLPSRLQHAPGLPAGPERPDVYASPSEIEAISTRLPDTVRYHMRLVEPEVICGKRKGWTIAAAAEVCKRFGEVDPDAYASLAEAARTLGNVVPRG